MGNQRCGAQGAVAGSVTRLLKGLTSVVDNSCRSWDLNTQPRVTSPMLYPLGHDCPQSLLRRYLISISLWRPHFFWRFLLKWELGICRPSPWPPVILTLRSAWPKPFCRGMSPKFLLSHHSQSYCRPSVLLPAGINKPEQQKLNCIAYVHRAAQWRRACCRGGSRNRFSDASRFSLQRF